MKETNYEYELYRNNLEQAVQLREKFMQFRNLFIYIIVCAVSYKFARPIITNGWILRVHRKNRKRIRNKKTKAKEKLNRSKGRM